jgi:eukaryotic-like serine/threonine-protein kinase
VKSAQLWRIDHVNSTFRERRLSGRIRPHRGLGPLRGTLRILDFGLEKLTHQLTASGDDLSDAAMGATAGPTMVDAHLTSPGTAIGTVAYMSPEQALGKELDARTDLFSPGVVLYEMATGQQAFAGGTTAATFDGILHKAQVSPVRLNPELPLKLEEIFNKLLEKDRDLRYQHASDLRSDLKRQKRDTTSGRAIPSAGAVATRELPVRGRWPSALARVVAIALLLGD